MTWLCVIAAVLAALPAGMTLWNLALFRPPPRAPLPDLAVSVVIPARDEAANIGPCLDAVRASVGVALEIVVVDDASRDATPGIVAAHRALDERVRLVSPPPLPSGWSGKPHACFVGAGHATQPILLFIDADVRLAPDAVARLATGLRAERLALASGFPRELAGSLGELLLVPLIHVLLLGYLPFALMRSRPDPGFGAGCGQVMMADAAAYHAIGGHGAVRRTWHDGVTLPRAFRAAGRMTGLFDVTGLASCRMYAGMAATWRGFGKNAREGLATPRGLPVWTLLLGGGHVLGWVLAALLPFVAVASWAAAALLAALALLLAVRLAMAARFRQGWLAVPLTPFGMLAMLALQWIALFTPARGAVSWRGRVLPS